MASATNATGLTRVDPIRKRYYGPLEQAEKVSGWLFYIAAITSFLPLIFNEKSYPIGNSVLTAAFVLLVIANFVLGIVIRLYFFPRAEDARRKEFISNAFNFDLIHQRTIGYYNNDETNPLRRIGMLVMENLFFPKQSSARWHQRPELAPSYTSSYGLGLSFGVQHPWIGLLPEPKYSSPKRYFRDGFGLSGPEFVRRSCTILFTACSRSAQLVTSSRRIPYKPLATTK